MPFIMGSFCGLMVTLGILGYMSLSGPGIEIVAHHLAIQCRLTFGGLLISVLLMTTSILQTMNRLGANNETDSK